MSGIGLVDFPLLPWLSTYEVKNFQFSNNDTLTIEQLLCVKWLQHACLFGDLNVVVLAT